MPLMTLTLTLSHVVGITTIKGSNRFKLRLAIVKDELRIDSRLLSRQLGNQHKAAMVLVERYANKFKQMRLLPFRMEVIMRKTRWRKPLR